MRLDIATANIYLFLPFIIFNRAVFLRMGGKISYYFEHLLSLSRQSILSKVPSYEHAHASLISAILAKESFINTELEDDEKKTLT